MPESVYDRAGGFAGVRRIIAAFYARVVASPVVGHHFHGIDMRRLIDHQTKFIASMMGGPATFDDSHLRRAHAHLGVTAPEFAELVRLLEATLVEQGLLERDRRSVLDQVRRREPLVVTARRSGEIAA